MLPQPDPRGNGEPGALLEPASRRPCAAVGAVVLEPRTPIETVVVKVGPTRILEGPIQAIIVAGKTRRFGGSLMGVVMNFVGLWSSCPTGAGS